jgi:O-antigen/teichoic acid export membrane protein
MPITFLFQFVLVRILGPNAYGEFIYAYTWFGSLIPLAGLGLQEATVRIVPEYVVRGELGLLKGFIRWSFIAASIIGSVTAGACILIVRLAQDNLSQTLAAVLVLAACSLPLGVLGTLFASILRARERFSAAQIPQQILLPILIVMFTLIGVSFFEFRPTAIIPGAALLISVVLFLLISFVLARNEALLIKGQSPGADTGGWADLTAHFAGLAVISMLARVDVLMMGMMLDTFRAGIYATAVNLHVFVSFGFTTMAFVTGPRISRLTREGNIRELQSMVRLATSGSSAIALGSSAILLAFGRPLLRLFDESFVVGYETLVILVFAGFFNVLTGPVGQLLWMGGHHREGFRLSGFAVLLNAGLNLVLIPTFGMNGAALSMLMATLVWKTIGVFKVRNLIGIEPSIFALSSRRSTI